jgi:gamma-glutamylcyclotransferase (GGCT)/AIG2-like uncharacterized protein YtfP
MQSGTGDSSTSDPGEAPHAGDTGPDLAVFVYGSLLEGVESLAHFCRGASAMHEAWAWGRLYLWAPNIPILEVPDGRILLRGSDDLPGDLRRSEAWARGAPESLSVDPPSSRGWRRIRGQVITFPDAERRLTILDAYEGFRPRTPAHYERVLIPVLVEGTTWEDEHVRAAWVYVLPEGEDPPDDLLPVDAWVPGRS